MYVSGMNPYFGFFFATTTLIIAVPTAIKVYNWVLTLWRGNIHLTVPMLFAIGFIFTFVNGGLTGLFLGNVSVDLPLSDTMFVVAHFHMVMAIAPILVVFGAIYHWYPKVTGRMLDDTLGKIHFWITFVGTYAIYYPMHYLGFMGVPRRYYAIDGHELHPRFGALAERGDHDRRAGRRRGADLVPLQPGRELLQGRPSGGNPGTRRRSSGRRRRRRPSTATSARSCRSSIAGRTTTACRASSRDFIPQNVPPCEVAADAWAKARSRRATAHDHHTGLPRAPDGRRRLVAVPPDDQRAALGRRTAGSETCSRRAGAARRRRRRSWVFLAVATSLFALFISAYAMRMHFGDWSRCPAAAAVVEHAAAGRRQRRDAVDAWRRHGAATSTACASGLLAGGVLTFAFLAGQLVVWQQLNAAGYFLGDQSRQRLLLPAHRGARPASCSAVWWLGPDHVPGCGAASRIAERLRSSVELCADLLALPARRLGRAVRVCC